MPKPVLLIRLEGPIQSWGTRSRWDVRDTLMEPTKSGIIGLLGCALGYPMGDSRLVTELDANLRFGVRVENPGRVIMDFQTITDFLPTAEGSYKFNGISTGKSLSKLRTNPDAEPSTIISPRYYLEDAAFLVALEETGDSSGLLAKCADALRNPVWPVYLGRKACIPTRPVLEALTDNYDSIEDAIRNHTWSWLKQCKEDRGAQPAELIAYIEDIAGELVRQDIMQVNEARQYGFRKARRIYIRPGKEEPKDVHLQNPS
ncbi:MAG: type I-E CRISPR-associated protein Cas5/CasD [Armatimonadota bacterium]